MHEIEIHKITELKAKNPTIIMGFPGTGLVGSVAASQIIDALQPEFIGYITSPDFAPLAAIHDYVPLPPARIHYSQKHNLVIIVSEMTIPVNSSLDLADKLLSYAKQINANSIISLGGISMKEDENAVYAISSDRKTIKNIISKKLAKPIREGATTGVTGILLSRGSMEGFSVLSILAEASQDYLDPKAAANVLKVLSSVIGISLDTTRLEREGKELTSALKESMIKSKSTPKKTDVKQIDTDPGGMFG
ncbi:MAG: PAC2 family protein [Candidatus Micrarchaeota archaeon]|nr:PAC2 family protein [Candidatus Micrarchaeota archaeon]